MTATHTSATPSPPETPAKSVPVPGSRLRFILTLGAIALAIALPIFWHKVLRHEIFPRNFGTVAEAQVYRSAQLTDRMLRQVIEEYNLIHMDYIDI